MPSRRPAAARARRALPAWLRIALPALLIVTWVAAAGMGGPYFGRVDEVSSNDATTFLPATADATRVQERLGDFDETGAVPAVVVFAGSAPLTPEERAAIEVTVQGLADVPGVAEGVSPALLSDDGSAVQAFVPIDGEAELDEAVGAVRDAVRAGAPAGVVAHVTGPAGLSSDLVGAFAGIDGILLVVALLAVLVILVVVYRSPILPLVVLATSMFALCVALLIVWWLARAGIVLLNGQTQGILFILVIGAATDYSLLYVARYREALRTHETRSAATRAALAGSLEPVLASGGTVIAGLLCLLLSDLRSNISLGPIASIGIVVAVLAALTFLPAVLFAAGRVVFWPRRPVFESSAAEAGEAGETAEAGEAGEPLPRRGVWAWLARGIAAKPRLIWVVTTLVLAAGCLGVLQLRADGVPQSELVLAESDGRDGQAVLAQHFPGGSGSPVFVLAPQAELDRVAATLLAHPGVDAVAVRSADAPSGAAQVTADGIQAVGPPGTPAPEPTVADGDVLLQATLIDTADSAAAQQTVRELRTELAGTALLGGETATDLDTNAASIHDRQLIIPIVLVVILAILMLLLRSILAPVLLILTTVLSFGTAMGVSALVFNHVLGFPGADPAVPLYGFVFLVALGIDYNIFLMTRVREESLVHGTRPGILRGLVRTGGVITSAGVVLAATFAALGVIPILFLAQLAVIVAFGVLLDTIVVRSLLVPALAYDIGRAVWWPAARPSE